MQIIIAGGTGLVGQALVTHYKDNHKIIVIGRDRQKINSFFDTSVEAITWDMFASSDAYLQNTDLIINLAGANIGEKRWTDQRKKELIDSRINTTQQLAKACAKLGKNSPALFNTSAVSVYGHQATKPELPPAFSEKSAIDFHHYPDFLAEIARKWELATDSAKQAGVRIVNMRFGVVLAKEGGALKQLLLPFKFFVGGKIGTGQQLFPWITLVDLVRAIDFLLDNPRIEGPVNFVAPEVITQAQLAKAISATLHRPAFLTTPAFVLKTLFGQMGEELLLNGQHVQPYVLLNNGFKFKYPDIDRALKMLLQK